MTRRPVQGESPFEGAAVLDDVANSVVRDIHRFFSRAQLEQSATHDERLRLAHELHDGLVQSLTGIALQLETVTRLLDSDPTAARARLRTVQELLAAEQQELRGWIAKLSRTAPKMTTTGDELAAALAQLCQRAERRWRLRCELTVAPRRALERTLGDHLYRIVQEGLNNIGRHAHGRMARVDVQIQPDHVDIVIEDDGVGFAFRGQYDLAELNRRGIGPQSLRKRVSGLNGHLVLDSSLSGSRLRISLPSRRDAWPAPLRSSASV